MAINLAFQRPNTARRFPELASVTMHIALMDALQMKESSSDHTEDETFALFAVVQNSCER
jgi:hypothetical protein